MGEYHHKPYNPLRLLTPSQHFISSMPLVKDPTMIPYDTWMIQPSKSVTTNGLSTGYPKVLEQYQ